jgi:hypothetical protein
MLDGKEYTFGVSGKLWRNGLVMYDHQTNTLWSGITGEGLTGPLKGKRLTIRAAVPKVRWKAWRTAYPSSRVLTHHGFQDYDTDQYADYHVTSQTGLFAPEHTNEALPPKSLVLALRLGEHARAYPLEVFTRTTVLNDTVQGTPLVIYRDPASEASAVYERTVDGTPLTFTPGLTWTTLQDTATGTTWNILTGKAVAGPHTGKQLRRIPHHYIYWFAWVDFYPQTTLYSTEERGDTQRK